MSFKLKSFLGEQNCEMEPCSVCSAIYLLVENGNPFVRM